jgi:hypothetical protein
MPQAKLSVDNASLLQAALEGLEAQKKRIEDQISEVRSMLGRKASQPANPGTKASPSAASAGGRRQLSSAARKRIAEAQKKRWADFRKKKQQPK